MLEFTEGGEVLFDGITVGDLHDGEAVTTEFWTMIAEGEAVYLPSEARYEPWDGEAVTWDAKPTDERAAKLQELDRRLAEAIRTTDGLVIQRSWTARI